MAVYSMARLAVSNTHPSCASSTCKLTHGAWACTNSCVCRSKMPANTSTALRNAHRSAVPTL